MPRPRRGAKGRLASPVQMDRLRAVLGMQLPAPVPFEVYRHMLRQHRNPVSHVETELKAWEHLESKDTEAAALHQGGSRALHEARLASGTPPREAKM